MNPHFQPEKHFQASAPSVFKEDMVLLSYGLDTFVHSTDLYGTSAKLSRTDRDPDLALLPAIHVEERAAWHLPSLGWGVGGVEAGLGQQWPLGRLDQGPCVPLPDEEELPPASPPAGLLGLGVHCHPQQRTLPAC